MICSIETEHLVLELRLGLILSQAYNGLLMYLFYHE